MLYLNQLDYRHIPYEHNILNGGVPPERRNVATSGCGLCCVCMTVEHLTGQALSLEDCVRLAGECGANRLIGTRLLLLGPAAAERFGMEYRATGDINEMLAHVQNGGEAVVNVGGDHDDHIGLFSDVGHYILVTGYDGNELRIMDPAYEEGRYEKEGRRGKVRVEYPFAFCRPEDLDADTVNRRPTPYHLFRRI